MNGARNACIAALMLLVAWPVTLQAESEDAASVEAALTTFLQGAAADRTVHERFWAEQLIYTSSSGERFGKAEIMSGFEEHDESAEATNSTPVYSAEEVRIRFENELALLTFTLIAETPGKPSEAADGTTQRYYNSGVLKNSAAEGEPPHWQAVLWQATRIPAAESALRHERQ